MIGFNPLYSAVLGLTGPQPALILDFMNGELSSAASFSRASNATQFNSAGSLVWGPSQLLSASNDLANGTHWQCLGAVVPTVTGGQSDPIGGTTAFLIDLSTAGDARVAQDIAIGKTPAGGIVTTSIWLKTVPGDSNGTYGLRARKRDSTSVTQLVNVTSAWQQFSVSIDIGAGASSYVFWPGDRGTGQTLQRVMAWRPMTCQGTSVSPYVENTDTTGTVAVYGPRFDFNPATLTARGLLIEEQRTNSLRNSALVGGVGGTPGTAPTSWAYSTVTGVTITTSYGTENGIPYVDVQYSGTNTSGSDAYPTVSLEVANAIAAANGQTWTSSAFIRKVGGADVTGTWNLFNSFRDAGGALISGQASAVTPASGANLALSRVSTTFTATDPLVAFVQSRIARAVLANGAAIDITLRIGFPQLEQGAFATSVIPTYGVAATRVKDSLTVPGLSWLNQAAGTFVVHATSGAANTNRYLTSLSNGTNSQRLVLYLGGGSAPAMLSTVAGVSTFAPTVAPATPIAAFAAFKAACTFSADGRTIVANGTGTANSAIAPATSGWTKFDICQNEGGGSIWCGWIGKVQYYPSVLSNLELQTLTT